MDGCGSLSIKALLELQNILQMAESLKNYLAKDFLETSDFSAIKQYFEELYINPSIVATLAKSIVDEDTIADSASAKLQDIRRKERKIEQDIRSKLNTILHSATYSKYMRENLVTIRSGRYVIPVKEEYRSSIKGFVHDMSSSGSTVFIEPISVFDFNNELSNLHIEEELEIERILQNLSGLLFPYTKELENDVKLIGKLDFIFAKAHYSLEMKCNMPEINDDKIINLKNARHPLIDQSKVVPISLELGKEFSSLIITGPNTGGKTVSLKTIGLLSAMACSGLNIPADEHSSIYVFDHIFADIGDEQSISESLSTFSSHISNIVKITQTATADSLILVDELGSGTDPLEGAHLAISILQYFTELGCLTVATSHYQELKKYALVTPGFKNASVEFDIENLKPTYRLLIGIPGKSNAFAISRKLGLDEKIIEKASAMIDKETVNLEDLLKNIYDQKSEIENEKQRTKIALQEAEELQKSLKNQHFDVSSKEKEMIANAKQEAKQILIEAKETANSIIREMDSTNSASKANKLRNKLNDKITSLTIEKEDIELPENLLPSIKIADIKPGLDVHVKNLDADGTVDGVIYADLAKGDNVEKKWNNDSDSTYTIPTVTEGLKDYYISKTNYKANDGFGTKDVISPIGTGKDRFYIMALTDIDGKRNGTSYNWYNAAYGKINNYATVTSEDFGTGKSNTTTMISKWNAKAYGDQGSKDMWGQIQEKVNNGWFVPSRAEWSAFGGELGISKDSSNEKYYGNFGLSNYYWSSSQNSANNAWYAYFIYGSMIGNGVNSSYYVRLSATF